MPCEYCEKEVPTIKRKQYRSGVHNTCADCELRLDADEEVERLEDAYDRAVDQSIQEWKDGGKVGLPRPVPYKRWR